jgi:hypothetical protein
VGGPRASSRAGETLHRGEQLVDLLVALGAAVRHDTPSSAFVIAAIWVMTSMQ